MVVGLISEQTLCPANKKLRQDALATTMAFGSMGRKANRLNYTIYKGGDGSKNTSGVNTNVLLAEHVSVDKDSTVGAFSHTTVGGNGQGSVRINIILTDPEDNETIRVTTATLMRNVWPR